MSPFGFTAMGVCEKKASLQVRGSCSPLSCLIHITVFLGLLLLGHTVTMHSVRCREALLSSQTLHTNSIANSFNSSVLS